MSSSVSSNTLVALSRCAAIMAAVSLFILFFLLVLRFTCTKDNAMQIQDSKRYGYGLLVKVFNMYNSRKSGDIVSVKVHSH